MAEERGATMIGGIEAEIRALRQDVTGLKVDVGSLKAGFEQMDKRMGTLERLSQWTLGIVLTTWITTMLAIITMSFTILSRLK
jgi:hypothetical protein